VGWSRYAAKRLAAVPPMLVGVSLLLFAIMTVLPGGPEGMFVGENMDAATIASVRRNLGLDEPVPVQYVRWLGAALRGDLGRSFRDGQPVLEHIVSRIPATLQLTAAALVLALAVAIPAGIVSATRRDSWLDRLLTPVAFFGLSFPSFWLGIMLILLFSEVLGWLPGSGIATYGSEHDLLARTRHAVLPTVTLASIQIASFMRYTRAAMLEVLGEEYVRTAHAKGLAPRAVLVKHALRNAMIPVVTVVGLAMPALVGGSVIVETVFAWPGLGRLAVDAVFQRDYPIIMGIELIIGAAIILANLCTDLTYSLVDPRVTYE
jgi:peptide/nickel transport system permease protein